MSPILRVLLILMPFLKTQIIHLRTFNSEYIELSNFTRIIAAVFFFYDSSPMIGYMAITIRNIEIYISARFPYQTILFFEIGQ